MRRALRLVILLHAGCGGSVREVRDEPPAPAPTPVELPIDAPGGLAEAVGRPVSIEGRDLVLRVEGAEVHVPYLSGHLIPVAGGQVVDLQAPRSFDVVIDALEVRIPDQSLQGAMSSGRAGKAPFRDMVVHTEGASVLLDGHTGPLNLPFSFRAVPMVTRGGGLALELEKVRLLGVGVRGFLGALQGPIEGAINTRHHFIEVDEDWLVLNPFPFGGPPEITAAFSSVVVRDRDIVARLGELTPREESREPSGLVLAGGALRIQKSVFFDVNLHLVAEDGGALVIEPDTFADQIVGGVARLGKDGDLTVFVRAPGQRPVPAIVPPAGGPEEPKTAPEAARAGELPANKRVPVSSR